MIYHNSVYQGAVYNINQICHAHFDPEAFEVSITKIVLNIYRNINKFCPIPLFILLDRDFYKVIYFL